MTPERWQRVQELFHTAEALPAADRTAWLAEACGADEALRREVEALIEASGDDHLERAVSGAVEELRAAQPAPASPDTISGYRILRRLGEGGMGIVYEAEQVNPRRTVALKVLRSARHASGHARRLFEREAQALARLRHPGIATIFESGVAEDGLPYLVMELVTGQPLDEWIKAQGPVRTLRKQDVEGPLRLFRAICDAVTYAHLNGVIHRDLKPSNIIVADLGATSTFEAGAAQRPLVKILDFGLARITDDRDGESHYETQTAMVQGSLPYMSPEQAQGSRHVDLRTDIYALGVLLYWMLTRQHPYLDGSQGLVETLRLIETAPPRRFGHWTRKYDADLEAIVLKAIEKDPERRYASVAGLAGDLDRYLSDQPILARPPSTIYQLRMLVRRNRAGFAGIMAAAVLLVAFSVTTAVQARRIGLERDRANQEAATAANVSDFLVDLFRQTNPTQAKGELTARDLLEAGRKRVNEELADQPELRARLLDRIGSAYTVIGPLSEAESAYEESLRIRNEAFGEGTRGSVDTWDGLAMCYFNQGRHQDSVRAARRALEIEERHVGAKDAGLAGLLSSLAQSLSAMGDTQGALEAIRRATEIDRVNERTGTAEAGERQETLGSILRQKGDYRGAVEVLRESLEIRRRRGETALDHGHLLNELGMALNLAGESKEAEATYRDSLKWARKIFGEKHGNIAMLMVNLAYAVEAQGRAVEAERLAREAFGVFDGALGKDHPRRGDLHLVLGEALAGQGRTGEARREFARAREMYVAAWGTGNPKSAQASTRLGLHEVEHGDAGVALRLFEEARAGMEDSRGTPQWAVYERGLGEAMVRAGQRSEGEALLRASVAYLKENLGAAHRETRRAESALARLLLPR